MLSRFFGKREKSDESPDQDDKSVQGGESVRDEVPRTPPPPVKPAMAPISRTAVLPPSATAPQAPLHQPAPAADLPLPASGLTPPGDLTVEQQKNAALEVVELHHHRIANTIRTLWGYRECSIYINKLIMAGGDGMGHARVGFNQDAVQAMLALSDLHDAEFGPPDSPPGGLGLSI